jgi:hypothetical protein
MDAATLKICELLYLMILGNVTRIFDLHEGVFGVGWDLGVVQPRGFEEPVETRGLVQASF